MMLSERSWKAEELCVITLLFVLFGFPSQNLNNSFLWKYTPANDFFFPSKSIVACNYWLCCFCSPDIQREEEKVKRSIKDAAKKGQKDVCVILAKELIRSRKAVSKLYASKAHMNSVLMGMKNQLGKNF